MSTTSEDFLDSPVTHVEILSLTISECYVYKVPPLRSASGHRAEDWKLDAPAFTGCLKVYQADTKLKVSIYAYKDPKNQCTSNEYLNLFGECPIEVKPGENIINFVDAVIDSSRYYVVRIKDPNSTRTTLIGVGFREREQAFDFKNTLNDYVRYVNRMSLASQMAACAIEDEGSASETSNSQAAAAVQHINPLKEGEKIKINIGGKKPAQEDSGRPKSGGGFSLKPPPAPGSTVFLHVTPPSGGGAAPAMSFNGGDQTQQSEDPFGSAAAGGEDDEWGDFK